MSRLAEALDVPRSALRIAAQNLEIPLPPAGHWTRLRSGQPSEPPPLADSQSQNFFEVERRLDSDNELRQEVKQEQADEIYYPGLILPHMRPTLTACLAITKTIATALAARDASEQPPHPSPQPFGLAVSWDNRTRALLTLDRAVRIACANGGALDVEENSEDPVRLFFNGCSFGLRLAEFEPVRRYRVPSAGLKTHLKVLDDETLPWMRLEITGEDLGPALATLEDMSEQILADRLPQLVEILRDLSSAQLNRFELANHSPAPPQIETSPRREAAMSPPPQPAPISPPAEADEEAATAAFHRPVAAAAPRPSSEHLMAVEEMASRYERANKLRDLAAALKDKAPSSNAEVMRQVAWIEHAANWLDPTESLIGPTIGK